MGNTGNSDTYPYGIRTRGNRDEAYTRDEVYNRVTGETIETFERFGVEATQKLNALVTEYKAATPEQKAEIVGEAKAVE